MKVLIDENLAPALARSLAGLFGQHDIVALRDRYPARTTDLEWIEDLTREGGWIVISGDRRIRKNKTEYAAFRGSGLVGFFLAKTVFEKSTRQKLIRILQIWPEIEDQVRLVRPGAMFEIPERSNRFRQL